MQLRVARFEIKYAVEPSRLAPLLRHLATYCLRDAHSPEGDWYSIRNLYLDNARFQIFAEAQAKLTHRLKLRVRGYSGSGPLKLEVKRRVGPLVDKRSATLSAERWTASAALGLRTLAGGDPLYAEFSRETQRYDAVPQILVAYDRLALTSQVDDYVRITFDKRIRCQRVTQWTLDGSPRGWRWIDDGPSMGAASSCYLMEVKFVQSPPAWVLDVVRTFSLRRVGFSKYGVAVQRLRPAEPEAAWGERPAPHYAPRLPLAPWTREPRFGFDVEVPALDIPERSG